MVEFGEELMIDTFRIPWLIWIQLVVFFLLIFLVYSFSVFGSDNNLCSSDDPSCSSSSSSSRKQLPVLHLHQAGDDQSMKAAINISSDNTGIRERRRISKKEGSNSSSLKQIEDGANNKTRNNNNNDHPCNIVRLAKIALLKCLGLDSSSSSSSSTSPNERR